MSENPEEVAKELEHAEGGELDESVLEDVSGGAGKPEEDLNVNNINGSC